MGNTSSNQASAGRPQSRRLDDAQSPSQTGLPHRSLRTKKRSLELPDLASLNFTPAHSSSTSPHRRGAAPAHAAPIPIPATPNPNQGQGFHDPAQPYRSPSRTDMPDVLVQHPSTHAVPLYPPSQRPKGGNPYYRPSVPYSSARPSRPPSFQALPPHTDFVQETVYSTIPIALGKAEEERTRYLFDDNDEPPPPASARRKKSVEAGEPVPFRINWHGGGTDVVLIRAGDENWQGRQPMDKDTDGTYSTSVPLQRGTHHIKFIVDGIPRIADHLPTAVADDGTLANYVAVPISGLTPPSTAPTSPLAAADSFWSNAGSSPPRKKNRSRDRDGDEDEDEWTQDFPEALLAAAREEEAYLAVQSDPHHHPLAHAHQAAPNIPPAPVLPRFLDKLILNSRPGVGVGIPARDGKEARREERRSRSRLQVQQMAGSGSEGGKPIPVTTASGTDVSAVKGENKELALDGPGLADDASVLPVPSHVVLQHLSTSAIKNGVLAVGTTIRYKKKYLTTIYYKPIS